MTSAFFYTYFSLALRWHQQGCGANKGQYLSENLGKSDNRGLSSESSTNNGWEIVQEKVVVVVLVWQQNTLQDTVLRPRLHKEVSRCKYEMTASLQMTTDLLNKDLNIALNEIKNLKAENKELKIKVNKKKQINDQQVMRTNFFGLGNVNHIIRMAQLFY
jgi:hypothetical protein